MQQVLHGYYYLNELLVFIFLDESFCVFQGAPLAYTPFCDNNKEMDGFRFWKQGFWQNHLQGRPYHISALYVVDLQKFRSVLDAQKT